MKRMGLVIPGANRSGQQRTIFLQNPQVRANNLGSAPRNLGGLTFSGPMIGRLAGSAQCGGCGK
jgi:hypothetical protein